MADFTHFNDQGRAKMVDVLTVAQIAGVMGAKRTPDIIPCVTPF